MASELCRCGAYGCGLTLLVYGIWHPYTRACRALGAGFALCLFDAESHRTLNAFQCSSNSQDG